MSLPKPQYSIWQAIEAALALAMRAVEETRSLARQPGPRGEQGERGKDAFAISEVNLTSPDGGRTLILEFKDANGEKVVSKLKTHLVLDRGVYREENSYVCGDGVSWDGSFWIAQQDSKEKPGQGSKAWRLAVKRGRDGKDGKSIQGPPGPQGEPGRDLTQLGPDGSKW